MAFLELFQEHKYQAGDSNKYQARMIQRRLDMRNTKRKADILIRVPLEMLTAMDDAAAALHISRVGFVRQAITRNLAHFLQHEKPLIEQIYRPRDGNSQV